MQPSRLFKVLTTAPAGVLVDAQWLQNADATASVMEIGGGPQLVAKVVETVAAHGWAVIGTKGSHFLANQVAEVANDWAQRLLGLHMETCSLQRAASAAVAAEWFAEAERRKGENVEDVPEYESSAALEESPMGFDTPQQRP